MSGILLGFCRMQTMNCQPWVYLPPPDAFPFLQLPEPQTQAVMKRKTPVLFDLPYQPHTRSQVARPDEHVMKREEVGDGVRRFLDTNGKHIFSFGFFVMLCNWAVIRVRASNISEPLPGRLAQRSEAEPRF
ncbi:unnamed protein product [Leuciscus chuanchicus]